MIDQHGTAAPSTETPDEAGAIETPEGTDNGAAQPDGEAAQADLDGVAEPDPVAPPEMTGEIPPEAETALAETALAETALAETALAETAQAETAQAEPTTEDEAAEQA